MLSSKQQTANSKQQTANSKNLALLIAISLTSFNTFATEVDVDFYADTNKTFALGGSYQLNPNINIGLGLFRVNGLKEQGVDDSLTGLYGNIEVKSDISDNLEGFIDIGGITGKTDDEKIDLSKGLVGTGVIYHFNQTTDMVLGANSNSTGYMGADYTLGKGFKLGVVGSYNFDTEDSGLSLTVTKGFAFGKSGNFQGMQSSLDKIFGEEVTEKYEREVPDITEGSESELPGGGED